MKSFYAALAACSVMACAGSARHTAPSPALLPEEQPLRNGASANGAPGVFEYSAMIKGREVRGRFAISGRIVIFDLPDATCRPTSTPDWMAASTTARYECRTADAPAPVHFIVDVRNPTARSTWEMTVTEQRQRSVCVEYVNRGGRNVCARTQTQTVDVVLPLAGPLLVRRSAGSAPPARQSQPTVETNAGGTVWRMRQLNAILWA